MIPQTQRRAQWWQHLWCRLTTPSAASITWRRSWMNECGRCNDPDMGKMKQRIFYSATVSTTNSTWTGLGSNAGIRGDRPAQPRNINSAHNGTTASLLHDTNLRRTVLVQEGVTLGHTSAEYPMRHVPSTARSARLQCDIPQQLLCSGTLHWAKSIYSETKTNIWQ